MAGGYYTSTIGQAYGSIVSGKITVSNAGTAVQLPNVGFIGGVWVSGDVNGSGSSLVIGNANTSAIQGSQSGVVILPGTHLYLFQLINLTFCI